MRAKKSMPDRKLELARGGGGAAYSVTPGLTKSLRPHGLKNTTSEKIALRTSCDSLYRNGTSYNPPCGVVQQRAQINRILSLREGVCVCVYGAFRFFQYYLHDVRISSFAEAEDSPPFHPDVRLSIHCVRVCRSRDE